MVSPADQDYSTGSDDEIASLPSESASDSDLETLSDGYSESDAEEEWRESMEQLELLLTMVLVPFVGKYLGRKCAYWSEFFFLLLLLPLRLFPVLLEMRVEVEELIEYWLMIRLDTVHAMEIPRRSRRE